jgi:hypothetical protein
MKAVLRILIFLVALLNLFFGFSREPASGQTAAQEEIAVYAAIIKAVFPQHSFSGKPVKSFVIENQSRMDDFKGQQIVVSGLKESLSGLRQETLDSFLARNQREHIHSMSGFPFEYQLANDEEVKSVIAYGEWRAFYEKYTDCPGLISFSKVGFNQINTQALVFLAFAYSEDGGFGKLLLLEKKDKEWGVKQEKTEWVWVG